MLPTLGDTLPLASGNGPSSTLRFEPATGNPYISPSTHGDIMMTRTQVSDEEATVELCNIPSVGMWFYHRAYPYSTHDFQADWEKNRTKQDDAVEAVKASKAPSVFPFTAIRDAKTGKLIGELGIFPSGEHPPTEGIWEVSYVLHPDYQGRGIAQAVVREAIEWARVNMGVKRLEAYAQCRNVPSIKLLDKLEFSVLDVKTYPWPQEKGGGEVVVARYQKEL